MQEQGVKRISVKFTQKAHERLKELKKAFGIPQQEVIVALLEQIDPNNPYVKEMVESYKKTRVKPINMAKELSKLSPEQLAKALAAAGIELNQ